MALPFPTILVLSLLLVASTVPLAHGDILDDIQIARVEVNGRLFCTASGNLEPDGSNSTGAVGANVGLVCGGNQTSIANATTDANGSFQIAVNAPIVQIISNITNCSVVVNLPIANCTLTPIVGQLVADLELLEVFLQPVVGAVARLVAVLFRWIL